MTLLIGLPGHRVSGHAAAQAPGARGLLLPEPSEPPGLGPQQAAQVAPQPSGTTGSRRGVASRNRTTQWPRAGSLGSNPAFATCELRDLGQVTLIYPCLSFLGKTGGGEGPHGKS